MWKGPSKLWAGQNSLSWKKTSGHSHRCMGTGVHAWALAHTPVCGNGCLKLLLLWLPSMKDCTLDLWTKINSFSLPFFFCHGLQPFEVIIQGLWNVSADKYIFHLKLIPRIHLVEERTNSNKLSSDLHICTKAHVHTHVYTHVGKKQVNKQT